MATEIKARLSLDSSAFTKGISAAMSSLSGMAGKVAAISTKAGAALAAIGAPLSAGAFVAGIKNAIEFGAEMEHLSARTGVAVKDLVILGQAFKNAGIESEQVGPMINRLQKALTGVNEHGEPTNKMFAKLGVNMEELRKLDPGAQFAVIASAISSLSDPAERAAAAMGIFGKSGGQMLQLFRDPQAIAAATAQVGKQAEALERSAAAMHKVEVAFASIKSTLRGFFVGVVEPLLPLLEQVGKWVASLGQGAVEFGQTIGKAVADTVNILKNAFQQGKLGELIGLSLKIAFGEAANYLGGVLLGVIDAQAAAFGVLFKSIFSGETIGPAFKIFLAIPEIIIGGLLTAMGRLAAALAGVFSYAIAGMMNMLPARVRKYLTGTEDKDNRTLTEHIADQNKGLAGRAGDVGEKIVADAIKRFADAGKSWLDIGGKAGKAYFEQIKKISSIDLINTEQWKAALAALAKELNVPAEALEKASKELATTGGGSLSNPSSVQTNVDQFAKIGLFSGNQTNSLVSIQQRHVELTQRLVNYIANGLKITSIPPVTATAG